MKNNYQELISREDFDIDKFMKTYFETHYKDLKIYKYATFVTIYTDRIDKFTNERVVEGEFLLEETIFEE